MVRIQTIAMILLAVGLALGATACGDGEAINLPVADKVDVLFIVDNSGSMVGEQEQLARTFEIFAAELDKNFGDGKYNIAIITTGMASQGCRQCCFDSDTCSPRITGSCINDTGEDGAFQNRLGQIVDMSAVPPAFEFYYPGDPLYPSDDCSVIDSSKKDCFYHDDDPSDALSGLGTVLVGTNGCGYEKGFAPMQKALEALSDGNNTEFLREDASLVIVVVSDEDDCGEVGDITENVPGAYGKLCYYAAKGIGPNNTFSHPNDSNGKTYQLKPVQDYYQFLMGLKDNRKGMVKFAAVVGVKKGTTEDTLDLDGTTIEYADPLDPSSDVNPICQATADCKTDSCRAYPGTRYIKMAKLFGLEEGGNGFVDTICQDDFSETLKEIGEFIGGPQ